MDPYLEHPNEWRELHNVLVEQFRQQLMRRLPDGYRARAETDLYIHEPPAAERRLVARADDAVVFDPDDGAKSFAAATIAPAVAPMGRLHWPEVLLEEEHRYIEVRTHDGRELVSVVELISPTNKGDGRPEFINKRHNLHIGGVHFLQIDLLRGGVDLLPEPVAAHDYSALLVRAGAREAEFWHWSIRDPLPVLPVPLKAGDVDVALDLRAALDFAYDVGEYGRFIYRVNPEPPLPEAERAWAAGLVVGR
jgi:hypothetical protein